MKFKVENIEACEPINSLLSDLISKGLQIEMSKIGDQHFNELYFLLKSNNGKFNSEEIQIDKIGIKDSKTFYCVCHWSIVEIR